MVITKHEIIDVSALAAGSGAPDFATLASDYIQKFIEQGGLVDMTDYMNKHKGEFPKHKVEMSSGKNGRIYGIPFDSAPVGLWYRKDIYDKLGIAEQQTWDEYLTKTRWSTLSRKAPRLRGISASPKCRPSTRGPQGL